jgi:hypothetical protein
VQSQATGVLHHECREALQSVETDFIDVGEPQEDSTGANGEGASGGVSLAKGYGTTFGVSPLL